MTPAGHAAIRAAWLASAGLLLVAAAIGFVGRGGRAVALVLGAALILFVAAYIAYLVRHLLFLQEIRRAEEALDRGELEHARSLLAPLLERYADLAPVQRAAGLALYDLGDPLSAASLLERAARSFRDDAAVAARLVAAYAALNRAGDARRAAALLPKHVDVRLALAWAELVARGGDVRSGVAIVRELLDRRDVRGRSARHAMARLLSAVVAARTGDADETSAAIRAATSELAGLSPTERAFLGYLEGIAWRELGRTSEAIATFDRAMSEAPGTIGEALARRERADLAAGLAAGGS